ncbi:SDR family oxidoreductase [Streptomyces hoynatensis]|uniref:SDR family oxidoreductase n=1 Tax=Streptomyces hoynatensis TaxID=1141874 RepID=A0A3A9YTS7_9ACTN|nr:SDR family oxidoreductase [Streptomyces hoynatensis]RKN39482.1 SDR family oxidoreductase [Streptomyces hoynatensis]
MTDRALVVITGASSGIGAAAARAFSAAGHPLLLLARRADRLAALGLPRARTAAVDVTDTAAVAAHLAAAEEEFGPTDLLINNAGLMSLAPVEELPAAHVQRMFDVNCVAPIQLARLVLPAMRARRGGTVMNIGSIAGATLYGDHTVYCGTKFALHAMTEGLRREMAPYDVRVLLISPGMVDTELLGSTGPGAVLDGYLDYKRSIGGGLAPEDIAAAMLHAYRLPQHLSLRQAVLAPTAQDA